jgi:ATP-dependent RNA helicase SUPV3L1/SUV3
VPPAAAPEAATDTAADETQFIEVWRLGRLEGPRRHRRPPRARTESHPRPEVPDLTGTSMPAAAEASSSASAGEIAPGAVERQDRKPRRHRGRSDQNRPDQNRPDQNRPDPNRSDQNRPAQTRPDPNRPDRGDRPVRHGRPDRAGRSDSPERDPELRAKYLKGRGESRERRDKAPDPNSPFAKLAALKEQLEANAKERR